MLTGFWDDQFWHVCVLLNKSNKKNSLYHTVAKPCENYQNYYFSICKNTSVFKKSNHDLFYNT